MASSNGRHALLGKFEPCGREKRGPDQGNKRMRAEAE